MRALLVILMLLVGCASTPNYAPPKLSGSDSGIIIVGTRTSFGAACLSSIIIDGKQVGTVGSEETFSIRLLPGSYLLRWDIGGICPNKEGPTRLITVESRPIIVKLSISGIGKTFIPFAGLFIRPDYRILLEGEE